MKQKLEAAIRDYYEGLGETLTMRHEFPILDTKPTYDDDDNSYSNLTSAVGRPMWANYILLCYMGNICRNETMYLDTQPFSPCGRRTTRC